MAFANPAGNYKTRTRGMTVSAASQTQIQPEMLLVNQNESKCKLLKVYLLIALARHSNAFPLNLPLTRRLSQLEQHSTIGLSDHLK